MSDDTSSHVRVSHLYDELLLLLRTQLWQLVMVVGSAGIGEVTGSWLMHCCSHNCTETVHQFSIGNETKIWFISTVNCNGICTVRCSYASAVVGVVILSVCLTVHLSVTCILFDKIKQYAADILILHERAITLVFWRQQWPPPLEKCRPRQCLLILNNMYLCTPGHNVSLVYDLVIVKKNPCPATLLQCFL